VGFVPLFTNCSANKLVTTLAGLLALWALGTWSLFEDQILKYVADNEFPAKDTFITFILSFHICPES
jgi:hypothetical protein